MPEAQSNPGQSTGQNESKAAGNGSAATRSQSTSAGTEASTAASQSGSTGSASATTRKAGEAQSDAVALLKADHRKVEELFASYEKARTRNRKQKLVGEICTELKIHAQIEEEIFYPAFRGKIDDDMLDEAIVEHDGAKVLINDIAAHGADDEFFATKVTVLCEEITHHVEEEEMPREGMFAQCRDTDVDLVALRDEMLERKQELTALAESKGLPPAELSAVNLTAA